MPYASDQERTEPATPKRREEARKKGQVAKSRELSSAVVLLGAVTFFFIAGEPISTRLLTMWKEMIYRSSSIPITPERMADFGLWALKGTALLIGPVIALLILVVVLCHLAQFGLLFSAEALRPDLSRIDPVQGMKRLFSMNSVFELLKNLVKLSIVGYAAWSTISAQWGEIFSMSLTSPWSIAIHTCKVMLAIGLRTAVVLMALAIVDYLYQRWCYERSLRMTREEVKEEYRQREGDPKVKARIRQRQMEMARRRMMADVPKADVVVTNPQSLAVALKYDRHSMAAPMVVAKGAGKLAEKIKDIARQHGIPIFEDKPIAQALYKAVDVGSQIPVNLYKAVAEILAHIYKQRARTSWWQKETNSP